MMQRRAFTMRIKPGFEIEYRKRHDQIWPELSELLQAAGIRDYSIYLDKNTGTLFAVQKLTADNANDDLPNHPLMKKGGLTWPISWKPIRTTLHSPGP